MSQFLLVGAENFHGPTAIDIEKVIYFAKDVYLDSTPGINFYFNKEYKIGIPFNTLELRDAAWNEIIEKLKR